MYIPTLDIEGGFYDKPINLDITHRCPLQCPSCIRQKNKYIKNNPKNTDISIANYLKILKTFSYIELSGQQSDPLCHPEIIELIFLSRYRKLDIHTATSHKKKDFYIEAFNTNPNATWIFGLDGLPADSHKHRVNQNGTHLFEMMQLGVEMGINVVWQYLVFNYNQNNIEEARALAKGMEFRLSLSSRWDDHSKHLKPDEEYCA